MIAVFSSYKKLKFYAKLSGGKFIHVLLHPKGGSISC